ncbi:hypothetical protein [Mucilaginibacter pedocola]|uniref:DUF4262 domain-containing protein n=1 Tax=Mucilaginibacter pedocola TaxID=1792845 RepID=A0A1S9PAQ0_9SPHI|nr:hypothetical protein [Mucilaginibacter pedocola]OOQ58042.1 hypothetical protein BC343_10290 [Mucilaginibacter pedocola]
MDKETFLGLIRSNIKKYSYHTTEVIGSTVPRYVYTIGSNELFGFELIFAGGIIYLKDDVQLIIGSIFDELKNQVSVPDIALSIASLGTFKLRVVDRSWSKITMLGVFDHYKAEDIPAYQIIPDEEHHTLDVPDMSQVFDPLAEPVWQWLNKDWNYPVSEKSTAITNLETFFGEPITELTRWEDDEWEMFTTDPTNMLKENMRVASIATLLAMDDTLKPLLQLSTGEGIWRKDRDSDWQAWG